VCTGGLAFALALAFGFAAVRFGAGLAPLVTLALGCGFRSDIGIRDPLFEGILSSWMVVTRMMTDAALASGSEPGEAGVFFSCSPSSCRS
jgi:hypothetical protein